VGAALSTSQEKALASDYVSMQQAIVGVNPHSPENEQTTKQKQKTPRKR